MSKMLMKEIKLAASPLTFLFLVFTLMTFIPSYPILVAAFFVSFGIFHTFQASRENNDTIYSVLLPISKRDIVKSKFIFTAAAELIGTVLFLVLTIVRMTALSDVAPYANNAMMNANLYYVGYCMIVFALFNLIFFRGFYKTGYYFGKPFVAFIIAAFLFIVITEVIHHIPGLEFLNTSGTERLGTQFAVLAACAAVYAAVSFASLKMSQDSFAKIDL